MATVEEIKDIMFYLVRKVNDIINYLTEEPQPPPRRLRIPDPPTGLLIQERIDRIKRSLNNEEEPKPEPQPTPETSTILDDPAGLLIQERIDRIKRSLNMEEPPPPPPSPSPQEMIKKFIKQDEERIMDLQKQAHEKRIIFNYLLDELIQRRERKEDANVIKLLEEEFERLRLERERLEKRIIKLKEHIRFMQN